MKKRYYLTSFIVLSLVVFLTTFFAFAYFFNEDSFSIDEPVGLVDVKAEIFFMEGQTKIDPIEIITISGVKKPNVYEVNVNNVNSQYFITKLRVNFIVNSSVDTIFRIRLIDTLTLEVNTPQGLQELSMPNVGIPYELGANWQLDQNTSWYYYMTEVKKENDPLVIPFIIEGLEFDLLSNQNRIQFGIKIEAVQAELGPENNWIDYIGLGGS